MYLIRVSKRAHVLLLLGFFSNISIGMAQSAGTFTATGNMNTPRFAHTATLLPNGKVLVAGGNAICFIGLPTCVSATSAELYDPTTRTFAATGSMTAVNPKGGLLLADDRVFFAGSDATGGLAIIEFYDSTTESFTVTGHAATLSSVESATLLNEGTVLLTGRVGNSLPPIYGAEIYDPVAGTFSALANWPTDDPRPLAVLVDGKVLLEYYEDNAGLLDPAAATFSVVHGLKGFDSPPRASLLFNSNILLTGGNDSGGSESSVELYDSASGVLAANTRMSTPRDGHTSTLLPDGTVLLAGGGSASRQVFALTSAEVYDPTTGRFSATGSLRTGRADHAAVLLKSGQVLITGGSTFGSVSSISGMASVEIYTPSLLTPAPVLFSLSGDGQGQGAIWNGVTGQSASGGNPATAGDVLSLYTISLFEGGLVPPQVAIGGRLAEILFFGDAPGYPGYFQVNVRVPSSVAPGSSVPVRLTYLGRTSNAVTIGVQ
jgi:hypothetical protein